MKAIEIHYSKVFSLGNFENEKIGIVLQLEDGETASEVLSEAKKFVRSRGAKSEMIREYGRLKNIVENPDNFKVKEVREATEALKSYEDLSDLPF